jgi:hypothetical protein
VLPLGVCWQLQDAPDYHLSRGRGQGRLRRREGVYCGPLTPKRFLSENPDFATSRRDARKLFVGQE